MVRRTLVKAAPAPAPAKTSSLIKDGFMWGIGNGVAHTLVNSIFRTHPDPVVTATTSAPLLSQASSEYAQCMKDFDDPVACRSLLPKGP
jgi:hypothetical protein